MGIDLGEPFPLYITRVRSRPLPPGDVGSLTRAGRVQRPAPTGSSFPTHLKRALALGARRVPSREPGPGRNAPGPYWAGGLLPAARPTLGWVFPRRLLEASRGHL